MRVRIDRLREQRRVSAGWFARDTIPAYCIYLTINFGEEERFLLRHIGLGQRVFFQAPIPPEISDPAKIEQLTEEQFRLVHVRDLLTFEVRTLLGAWPDLIAADGGEADVRVALEQLADQLARGSGTADSSVVYEL